MKQPLLVPAVCAALTIGGPARAQDMASMPGMDMSHHDHATAPASGPATAPEGAEPTGTDQPPGSAEAPPVADDLPAARYYDPQVMAAAAHAEMHPARPSYAMAALHIAEYRFASHGDGYAWEGEAWTGDLDRFVLRSQGEGATAGSLESAELQVVYSRAVSPWWNLQLGVRQDVRPTPARTYATFGIEGLAPYKFDVLAQAFVSNRGELTARLEASVDQHLTRRLILQPRIELNLSAQDMPAQRLGAGLTEAQLGLRLGLEISRQLLPYVGVQWNWATGRTADYLRADGEPPHQRSVLVGLRGWF